VSPSSHPANLSQRLDPGKAIIADTTGGTVNPKCLAPLPTTRAVLSESGVSKRAVHALWGVRPCTAGLPQGVILQKKERKKEK
jgi:hypothetical protein